MRPGLDLKHFHGVELPVVGVVIAPALRSHCDRCALVCVMIPLSCSALPYPARGFVLSLEYGGEAQMPSSPSSTVFALLIFGGSIGLSSAPVFTSPILCTTLNPLFTLPNIVCFPSSQGVGANVMLPLKRYQRSSPLL